MLEHTFNAKLNTWEPELPRIVPVVPSFYLLTVAVTPRHNTAGWHNTISFHVRANTGATAPGHGGSMFNRVSWI